MSEALRISGATRLYAIVGDPIAQVRSPEVFTARFAAAGVDAVLIPVHVPTARFDAIAPALLAIGNLDGVLVTIPFKARIVPYATRLGPAAQCIDAANALRREADGTWTGDMFDGVGFVRGAQKKGERIRDRRVALFGAGGAGSAIAYELANAGARSIAIIDVDAAKAERLAVTLSRAFPACSIAAAARMPEGIDMIVNASPVGMQPGHGMPAAISSLDARTLVGDVVIARQPTALIRHALHCGCPIVDGRDMHGGQVDALMQFFASATRAEPEFPTSATRAETGSREPSR
ncbi:MAG TPA: ThiF family adenylyltransferase [Casimicrobiaceae bacterium]|nr:ThiF family adenylyltransferase [Casimicrobiaceae bacterium]